MHSNHSIQSFLLLPAGSARKRAQPASVQKKKPKMSVKIVCQSLKSQPIFGLASTKQKQ